MLLHYVTDLCPNLYHSPPYGLARDATVYLPCVWDAYILAAILWDFLERVRSCT